jgi:uncharacterized membrane protein YccC
MTEVAAPRQGSSVASSATLATRLANASRAAGPPLFFGLRLWVSVCLALYLAFWLELDDPDWAGELPLSFVSLTSAHRCARAGIA